MTATTPAGRRLAWLGRLGLLGAVVLLVLTASVAVGTAPRLASTIRRFAT
jgi:hypothetical protein